MPPTAKFVAATATQQMLHLLPMVAMLFMYFVGATGSLTFPWQFQRSKVCIVRLSKPQDLKDLALIRAWAISKGPSTATSTHWWYEAPTPETPKERCLDKVFFFDAQDFFDAHGALARLGGTFLILTSPFCSAFQLLLAYALGH